jgi:hypothetical protein
LHEVNVSALNETQNVDFTTEKENKKLNSRKKGTHSIRKEKKKPNRYEIQDTQKL